MAAKKKSRSGTKWSEEDYEAAGKARVNLRIPQEAYDKLQAEAERRGTSFAGLIVEISNLLDFLRDLPEGSIVVPGRVDVLAERGEPAGKTKPRKDKIK